jgi:phosphatidylglycerol:prolipoprotein diacylglycerol transferase
MFAYMQLRFWLSKDTPRGQMAGEFLIGYSIARIVMEVYREADMPLILGLSRGQFLSIFLLVAGVLLVYFARRQRYRYS